MKISSPWDQYSASGYRAMLIESHELVQHKCPQSIHFYTSPKHPGYLIRIYYRKATVGNFRPNEGVIRSLIERAEEVGLTPVIWWGDNQNASNGTYRKLLAHQALNYPLGPGDDSRDPSRRVREVPA